jgi:hypothetical protein
MVNHMPLFFFAWLVAPGKTDDTGAVAPLVGASIDQVGHDRGIAAKNLRQWIAGKLVDGTIHSTQHSWPPYCPPPPTPERIARSEDVRSRLMHQRNSRFAKDD